jgi:glyoxylase-like metal-dependent hydrolase (beta-lactamase superfamily II)
MTQAQWSESEKQPPLPVPPIATGRIVDIAPGCFAYGTETGVTSGILIGSQRAIIIDAQPTAALTQDLIARVSKLTQCPLKYVVLTSHHPDRVANAGAFGSPYLVGSSETRDLIQRHNQAACVSTEGMDCSMPLPVPSITFGGEFTIHLGDLDARIFQPGRGVARGNSVVWVSQHKLLFAGDLIEDEAVPDMHEGHLREWPATLDTLAELQPERMVAGHAAILRHSGACQDAIFETKCLVETLYEHVRALRESGHDLTATYRHASKILAQSYGDWDAFDANVPLSIVRAFEEIGGQPALAPRTKAQVRALRQQLGLLD